MILGLDSKFALVATILGCAAAVFVLAPEWVSDMAAPQAAVAEENPSPLLSGKCESATWPNIPAECLTRADSTLQVAGAD